MTTLAAPVPPTDWRVHPAAWAVAVLLHVGLFAVLLRPTVPVAPAGTPLSLGLAGLGGAGLLGDQGPADAEPVQADAAAGGPDAPAPDASAIEAAPVSAPLAAEAESIAAPVTEATSPPPGRRTPRRL